MSTIYEIQDNILEIERLIEHCEAGELEEADAVSRILYETLIQLSDEELPMKLERYAQVIKNQEAKAKACKEEADRITAKVKAANNSVLRMKEAVKSVLEAVGRTKVEAGTFTWAIQANGGKVPLVVSDDIDFNKVPDEFIEIEKSLNSNAVRAALESGKELGFASLGEQGTHIRLR